MDSQTVMNQRLNVQGAIRAVVEKESLGEAGAHELARAIMDGAATPAQIGAVLVALRMRGETFEELLGFVRALRERMLRVSVSDNHLIDTCGTGGDGAGTFNVSTVAALVAAGAGCRVAKHGNRAVSGRCGSADVLHALGVRLEATPTDCGRCLERAGLAFLFAPAFHPSLRHAAEARREIGVRTLLNLAAPLANPAGARRQLVGVFDERFLVPMVRVLQRLNAEHCLVVHGEDGLDEITTTGTTHVAELRDGDIYTYDLHPLQFDILVARPSDLIGGDARAGADRALQVLSGQRGPARDIVLLNAGAAIYVAGRAASIAEGVRNAGDAIDSGAALSALKELIQFGREAQG
jgi:anthranilate phosphoribosyltransferase